MELLLQLAPLPAQEQKDRLTEAIARWKGGYEQVYDILVIGVRV